MSKFFANLSTPNPNHEVLSRELWITYASGTVVQISVDGNVNRIEADLPPNESPASAYAIDINILGSSQPSAPVVVKIPDGPVGPTTVPDAPTILGIEWETPSPVEDIPNPNVRSPLSCASPRAKAVRVQHIDRRSGR